MDPLAVSRKWHPSATVQQVAWGALTLDTENKCFRMNVSKEQLKDAPGFDKDHWPTMADQSWAQQVHDYYGAEPYWY